MMSVCALSPTHKLTLRSMTTSWSIPLIGTASNAKKSGRGTDRTIGGPLPGGRQRDRVLPGLGATLPAYGTSFQMSRVQRQTPSLPFLNIRI